MSLIETLTEFKARTEGFSRDSLWFDEGGRFFVSGGGLAAKVDGGGGLAPFYGDTMVFLLDGPSMERLAEIQGELYRRCPGILADPLGRDTFHLTLHDLNSGDRMTEELAAAMERGRERAGELLREIRGGASGKIVMRSTWLFNLMNTSVVLGFAPVDEENCRRLMELYEKFQAVVELPHRLTPHVTMAYYKPGVYDRRQMEGLERVIRRVEEDGPLYLELATEKLVYQRFTDMGHYETWE